VVALKKLEFEIFSRARIFKLLRSSESIPLKIGLSNCSIYPKENSHSGTRGREQGKGYLSEKEPKSSVVDPDLLGSTYIDFGRLRPDPGGQKDPQK
jgi:hypothetical protein